MLLNSMANAAVLASEESISSLVPKVEELIVGLVGFLVLLWILKKFAYPQFEATFQERTAAIEGGIEKAEKAQEEAAAALAQKNNVIIITTPTSAPDSNLTIVLLLLI